MRPIPHLILWRLGLARAETQTTEAERDCLARYAEGRARLVEIGVWHGVTTRRLRAVMARDGLLYAVDPYAKGRLGFSAQRYIAQRVVRKVRNGNVRWVRQTGQAAGKAHVAAGGDPVDFVFIDGDHSYEALRGDWEAWADLIAPGGIVTLHDSQSTPERDIDDAGSVCYTRDVIVRDSRFEVVETVDSLTVLRRREEPA